MKRYWKNAGVAGLALNASLWAMPGLAAAQVEPAPQGGENVQADDEILVTARRRGEAIQNVPIAITVLTAEDIAKSGIEGMGDIAKLSPNVTFQNALNLGTNYLTIRGQGQSQYSPPPAAIVVDGVLTISPLQFNVDEFDLQQIEVLKGPQGAIYGRNAIAGALNITTRKPGSEFEGRVLAGYGRGEEWKGKLSISGPIVQDTLYALAGISVTDRRGQERNITNGTYFDRFEDLTGRLRVVFTPADDVEFDVKYTYSDAKGRDPAYITSRTGNPRISSDPLDADRVGSNPRTLHDLSGKVNWNLGFASATLTLAYVDVKESLAADFDFGPLDIIAVRQAQRESGFSQELRFASAPGARLRWLVGAYHVKSKRRLGADILVDPFFFGLTPAPTQADFLFSSGADINRYETWSGFGQIEYDVLPSLELALALRYDDDTLRQSPVGVIAPPRRAGFSKWQPKASLTYKGIEGLVLYGSVGQGFRSGDFNASGASFGNPVIAAESATSYEIGAKARLFHNALAIDAAIFRTDLRNGQFKLFDAVGATNVGVNIDQNRITGFEIAAALRIADGFSLNGSIGYADSEVRDFTPPPGFGGSTLAYIGNTPPRVSKYTFNAGADIDIPVSDKLSVYMRPAYRHIGKFFWNLENTHAAPAQDLLDFRIGLRNEDAGWSVTGWMRNALSERVTGEYQPFVNSGHPLGIDAYYPTIGSTYGIEVTFRF